MGWIMKQEVDHDSANPSSKDSGDDKGKLSSKILLICTLLLLASALNYMDRQTLSSVAPRIKGELGLTDQQYGTVEAYFGWGFALGSLVFGFLVDRIPTRWMYPAAVFSWSFVGFLTGYARNYDDLLYCRGLLGFFEAAHWPCGLKTTQYLLASRGRGLGNSVLQSGTSIGAFITPLLMLWILTPEEGSWRIGFQAIGLAGLFWIAAWFIVVKPIDLKGATQRSTSSHNVPWWVEVFNRKFFLLLAFLLCINATWQIMRAWLPIILQEHIGYTERQTLIYNSIWYIFTDIGCIGAGALAFALAARGWSIKGSRTLCVGVCAVACATLALIPFLPKGYLLLAILLLAGAGTLGLFPMYYAFSQDVSKNHQGKVTGLTGIIAWYFTGVAQMAFGRSADETKSFDTGLIMVALLPLIATLILYFFWPEDKNEKNLESS